MSRYRVISADAHVLEPKDIWQRWLPQQYQDKAPKLVKDEDGGDAWLHAGNAQPDPIGLVSTPGMAWDDFRWTGITYEDARAGCYDGKERLRDMDLDGVDAEILFPPQRTIGHFLGDDDDDFVRAGVQAYNDFLWEEFTAPDRSRLIGLAQISSLGVDSNVEELRAAKERGFKGVVISGWPSGGDSVSEDDDPFWAAAVEAGMPVVNHIGMKSRSARQKERQAATNSSSGILGRTGRDAKKKVVGGLGGVFTAAAPTISSLIFTGVFERFRDLHFSIIEIGAGWIPHFLEQLDDRWWRNRGWAGVELQEAPSFYWRRNMSASFIVDRTAIALRHSAGVHTIMWSTDYPHHGNDWPYSRKTIDDMMFGVPEDEKQLLIAGNAARIFHLE